MRILVDTNIFLDVLLEREGLAEKSQAVLDWCENHPGEAWMAWHTLTNLYYIGTKTVGKAKALAFVDEILSVFEICAGDTLAAGAARDLAMPDFEDALQAVAAKGAKVSLIVTRNVNDYRRSPIPAATPESFLRRVSSNK